MHYLLRISISSAIILFTAWIVSTEHGMDYSDIEFIGGTCPQRDTCDRAVQLSFQNRSCECDNKCHKFDDCCIDAPASPSSNAAIPNPNIICLKVPLYWSVFVVNRCPESWQDYADIKSKCEGENNISEPIAFTPSTDIHLNMTYKNRYCAQCNNVQAQNLRSWDIQVECETMPNGVVLNETYIKEHLVLNNVDGEDMWGFYYSQDNSTESDEPQFYSCSLPFRLPENLHKHVRLCTADLISSCANNWRRQSFHSRCKAYTAVIAISQVFYKNPHCAMCNFQDLEYRSCNAKTITISPRQKKPAMSFTEILNVRNDSVLDNGCPSRQKWDPFAKKCRSTRCAIPSYRPVNGRCVPP